MSLEKFSKIVEGLEKIAIVGPFFHKKYLVASPLYLLVDKGAQYQKEIEASQENSTFFKVGDGDSYTGELDIKLAQNKDFSDLKFCLDILPSHINTLYLLGFIGGRVDHQLFVWGEVHHYLARKKNTKVLFDDGVFAFSSGRIKREIHGCFSIAVISSTEL
ncbi:MAG: hypothetical protein OXB84_08250, partial [Halobacteriovoraceae bacterium]|nr:hypothetical protein [Halobacteriovoraceae bacterium]